MSDRGEAQLGAIKTEGLAVIEFIESREQRDGIKAVAISIALLALAENLPHLSADHTPEQIGHVRELMLANLRETVALLERQA